MYQYSRPTNIVINFIFNQTIKIMCNRKGKGDSYTTVVRLLYDSYTTVMRLLYDCYTTVIRLLYDCYTTSEGY